MSRLSELTALLGPPPRRRPRPSDWAEVERHVGSPLPGDYKEFMDAYGTGVISGELVVLHPLGSSPLLPRMREVHERQADRRRRAAAHGGIEHHPYPVHPEPGGLVFWGHDPSGDEHFFLPTGADPDRWEIVTMAHEEGCETFAGPFTDFVLSFVACLRDVDGYHGVDPAALEFLEPEDLAELAASGEIGPVQPGFEPF
ncbi:SMI1/KNR4 family protein [Kitasatospora sp. NPDC088391]|uniref:SMI1/KNR4 family protein n=1 Tax=Kitasatospora sp. NPDC088391 TaxID=3364074 RepID=UPI0038252CD0